MKRSYEITHEQAVRIEEKFNRRNESYLRSLVAELTGNGEYADSLSYYILMREGREIFSAAKKVLKAEHQEPRAGVPGAVVERDNLGEQLPLFS